MKISYVKLSNDNNSFKIFKNFGMQVLDIEKPEDTDLTLQELVKQNYDTIIISNELAGFSEDIITKYAKSENTNIIIMPRN